MLNGASYQVESENLEKFGFEVGVGFAFTINNNINISLQYQGNLKKDYQDYSGVFNVRYNF